MVVEQKLNSWPNKVLNKNINFNQGIGKEFDEIRTIRNNLVHFTSDYESVAIGNIEIKGLANTEAFDSLRKEDAERALRVAKEFIEHILLLSGVKNKQIPHAIHQWAGLVPEHESYQGASTRTVLRIRFAHYSASQSTLQPAG